jgi:hypothetical protein
MTFSATVSDAFGDRERQPVSGFDPSLGTSVRVNRLDNRF